MLLALKAFKDNYIWLYSKNQQHFLVIDPGEADIVIDYFKQHPGYLIEGILLTHHHADHTAGVKKLRKIYPDVPVYASFEGEDKGANHILAYHDQQINTAHFSINALATPGHTLGHICYLVDDYLFSGDTLFSFGCGRVFEGTHQQMFNSLAKLKSLTNNVQLCAGHEYTVANLDFVKTLAELSIKATDYQLKMQDLYNQQGITLPSNLAIEKALNPFLLAADVQQFTALRNAKDIF